MKEKNKKQSEDFFVGLFKWKLDQEQLRHQIENYNTLGFLSSARKVATGLMIFSAIITLIFTIVEWFPSGSWIDVVLILTLALFVYKEKKWAIIVTMIYWTFSKTLQMVSGFSVENFSAGNIIMPIIWWAIFMGAFSQAHQVEREKTRLRNKSMPEQQPYHTPAGIPVEVPTKHPGRIEGIIAIICAVIALGFFPPIFGIIGIILGVRARKKGEDTLGLIAITLSAVFMVIGFIIGAGLAILGSYLEF